MLPPHHGTRKPLKLGKQKPHSNWIQFFKSNSISSNATFPMNLGQAGGMAPAGTDEAMMQAEAILKVLERICGLI